MCAWNLYGPQAIPPRSEGAPRVRPEYPSSAGAQVSERERLRRAMAAQRSWNDEDWDAFLFHGEKKIALPEGYKVARDFARGPQARAHDDRWVFRRQAEMLADLTDDFAYQGHFEQYFPTYQAMTDRQLRGYVTWRTQVRAGNVQLTCPSFAYVHVFELLACVGAPSPQACFDELLAFWEAYSALGDEASERDGREGRRVDAAFNRHMRTWLRDFVVYYDLPRECLERIPSVQAQVAFDAAVLTLQHAEQHTAQERFAALSAVSAYHIRSSRLAKDYPQDVCEVALAFLRKLQQHYDARRKTGFFDTLFGPLAPQPHAMFAQAVFSEGAPHADATYVIDEANSFTCKNGAWTHACFLGAGEPSGELGVALKVLDARMRVRLGYAHPLREPKAPQYVARYAEQAISEWLEWKRAHEPRRIAIDRSKLGTIRQVAAVTREELLVEEEREEAAPIASPGTSARAEVRADRAEPEEREGAASAVSAEPEPRDDEVSVAPDPSDLAGGVESAARPPSSAYDPSTAVCTLSTSASAQASGPCGLTPAELAFLRSLLADAPQLPPGAPSVDMLVDSINEKLFDMLGDVALEMDALAPAIVEDYLEDVRGIVCA